MKSREYYQGVDAALLGDGYTKNPYPIDTQEGKDWHEGNRDTWMEYADAQAGVLERKPKGWEW